MKVARLERRSSSRLRRVAITLSQEGADLASPLEAGDVGHQIDRLIIVGAQQQAGRSGFFPFTIAGADAIRRTDQRAQVNQFVSFFNTFLLVFAGIALFVGAFLIANTFSILIGQRTRELALLRAVGASRAQVTRSMLGEALAVELLPDRADAPVHHVRRRDEVRARARVADSGAR